MSDDHLGTGFAVLKDLLDKIQSSCFYKMLVLISAFFAGYFLAFLFLGNHAFFDFSKEQICSAYIQGLLTLLAGTFVLIAGYWAYRAATRETRLHEEQDKSKRQAYREMMAWKIEKLLEDVEPSDVVGYAPPIPAEIKLENWENHALLKENEIKDLRDLYETISKIRYEEEPKIDLNTDKTNTLISILKKLSKSLKEPYS